MYVCVCVCVCDMQPTHCNVKSYASSVSIFSVAVCLPQMTILGNATKHVCASVHDTHPTQCNVNFRYVNYVWNVTIMIQLIIT